MKSKQRNKRLHCSLKSPALPGFLFIWFSTHQAERFRDVHFSMGVSSKAILIQAISRELRYLFVLTHYPSQNRFVLLA
ncbi:hypothetical protein [Brucella pituitosa]|uniref:Uncharacterized protein n=1 Tax=Brucella pituitosa TaxID=571256 RepID=A0ABS3K751_9HYPH|nr:hypothetical protein [Brucella pituitosa]MBO1041898.1 hypothetical protein [Brucella pituitosa]